MQYLLNYLILAILTRKLTPESFRIVHLATSDWNMMRKLRDSEFREIRKFG